jgi:hypothetical protein
MLLARSIFFDNNLVNVYENAGNVKAVLLTGEIFSKPK